MSACFFYKRNKRKVLFWLSPSLDKAACLSEPLKTSVTLNRRQSPSTLPRGPTIGGAAVVRTHWGANEPVSCAVSVNTITDQLISRARMTMAGCPARLDKRSSTAIRPLGGKALFPRWGPTALDHSASNNGETPYTSSSATMSDKKHFHLGSTTTNLMHWIHFFHKIHLGKMRTKLAVCDISPDSTPGRVQCAQHPDRAAGFTLQMDGAIFTWVTGVEL